MMYFCVDMGSLPKGYIRPGLKCNIYAHGLIEDDLGFDVLASRDDVHFAEGIHSARCFQRHEPFLAFCYKRTGWPLPDTAEAFICILVKSDDVDAIEYAQHCYDEQRQLV